MGRSGSGLSIRRVLFGAKGTIRVLVTVHADLPEPTTWRITEGSEAFAELRGKGKETGGVEAGRINITMRGTVSQ